MRALKKIKSSIFSKLILIHAVFAVCIYIFIFILLPPQYFISSVIFFTAAVFILYLVFKKLLVPLSLLSQGVEKINSGDTAYKFDINSADEFGITADLINNMTEKISNSVKAKETLIRDVSHELRTPLTRIKLSVEFIENERVKSRMKEDVKDMEQMVSELLDNYKKESELSKPEITEFDLNELIEKTSDKFINERIKFSPVKEILNVKADKRKIETVIKNLIDNALKYSKENVEINAERNPENTSGFILKIKDNGDGISEAEIKYIFEPFYRVDKSRNKAITGYGLGLNIVKKIIDAHNGTIEVKSEKDKGTEFIVTI